MMNRGIIKCTFIATAYKTNKGLRIDIVNLSKGTFDRRVDALDNPNFARSSVSSLSQLLSNH